MLTIPMALLVIALGLTLVHGITGKVPLWIPLLFVELALLVR